MGYFSRSDYFYEWIRLINVKRNSHTPNAKYQPKRSQKIKNKRKAKRK